MFFKKRIEKKDIGYPIYMFDTRTKIVKPVSKRSSVSSFRSIKPVSKRSSVSSFRSIKPVSKRPSVSSFRSIKPKRSLVKPVIKKPISRISFTKNIGYKKATPNSKRIMQRQKIAELKAILRFRKRS